MADPPSPKEGSAGVHHLETYEKSLFRDFGHLSGYFGDKGYRVNLNSVDYEVIVNSADYPRDIELIR